MIVMEVMGFKIIESDLVPPGKFMLISPESAKQLLELFSDDRDYFSLATSVSEKAGND